MPAFARHFPPSADRPRVLALDPDSARSLPPEIDLSLWPDAAAAPGPFDAIVGADIPPSALAPLQTRLRPGGRIILTSRAHPQTLLDSLTAAGYIHCLVETADGLSLYRGERPPEGPAVERIATLAESSTPNSQIQNPKFLFLLVSQTPNKPAWTLGPDETVEWQAATVLHPHTGAPALLAFTSLVKAVAFMQPAVLAGVFQGINKVGKFPASAAALWPLPYILNPSFDDLRAAAPGPALEVDPHSAITGEE